MTTDLKKIYGITSGMLVVLLTALLWPGIGGRIAAAVLLSLLAVAVWLAIPKRSVLSIYRTQVLILMSIVGLVYLALYYLAGTSFGFVNNGYRTGLTPLLQFALPISLIIVATEVIRYVVLAQDNKWATVLGYLTCVVGEIFVGANLATLHKFTGFMDFIGLTLFPAILSNILYHYLSKRYGMYPNIAYRLIITLYAYILPVTPAVPDALFSFANMLIPVAIYVFMDALYEKKKRQALGKKSKAALPVTVLLVALMASAVMLISNQFSHGVLIIATPSMTGEINQGDAAIYEVYEDQPIELGQVIVFEKDGSTVVHRVVDIQYINNEYLPHDVQR